MESRIVGKLRESSNNNFKILYRPITNQNDAIIGKI